MRLADVRLYSSTLDLNVMKRDTLANLINKYFKNGNEMAQLGRAFAGGEAQHRQLDGDRVCRFRY